MFPKNQYSFPAGVDRKEEGSVWRVHGVQKKEGEGSRGPETAVQWTAIRYMLFSIRGFYIHISLVFDTAAHGKNLVSKLPGIFTILIWLVVMVFISDFDLIYFQKLSRRNTLKRLLNSLWKKKLNHSPKSSHQAATQPRCPRANGCSGTALARSGVRSRDVTWHTRESSRTSESSRAALIWFSPLLSITRDWQAQH